MHRFRLFLFLILCFSTLGVSAQESKEPKAIFGEIKLVDMMQDSKNSQAIAKGEMPDLFGCSTECVVV